ncbi:PREDICTED: uncharacterized protein LOC108365442 [Rhagoletis zephyria]|uniref:uncharacterized protein LOC108365442 n=1 Tax=Rhagoletis zephyria TaxID=28612 RepID=UPI000811338C|nr:PREDICTED: uncharacterized protein LOC108365442 [Rhagoletis zephyria]
MQLNKNLTYMCQRNPNLGVQIAFNQQSTAADGRNTSNNKQYFNMQIINSSTGNVFNGLSCVESKKTMDTTETKYLDSNSIKSMSPPPNDSTFNSTVEETILVSTNATPLRQIITPSALPATSSIMSPSYTSNFQDVRSENVVLIPTPNSLEQYRLQLYNYALSIDRLRCPQYTAATTMAAAAYASGAGAGVHLLLNRENNHTFGSIEVETESNYPNSMGSVRSGGGSYAPTAIAHGNRLALSMSLFPQRIFHPEEPKPQYSYIGLIAMAILSSAETKLVLSDIYQYILDHYPYFRARGPGWRNSIRHNLSLNDCFIKSGRSANGKGHYWAIHPANIDDFRKGDFRRRKAQRKVRKHMGLSLDDAGTDSPSPPPLDLTSPPLTSAHVLRLAPAGNNLTTGGHEFLMAPGAHAFGCLQQKNYPILQVPTSLVSLQSQQQIQDRYFGAAITEQYTCIPSAAYNNRLSTRMQQQHQHQQHQQEHFRDSNDCQSFSQAHDHDLRGQKHASAATAIASSSTTTAIASLYSQTRKRQFDVASLLAPDRKDFAHEILDTDQQTVASVEEAETLQHAFVKKFNHENAKEYNRRQQHDEPVSVQFQHPSHSLSNRQAFPTPADSQPQKLLAFDEQEQDEIDVVANDIEEHSKQAISVRSENDDEDPYDAVEDEEQTFIADGKDDSSSGGANIYVDGESECIIDASLHKRHKLTQQESPLPGAVIEWHMLRPHPTTECKNAHQPPVSSANAMRQKDHISAVSTTTLTPTTAAGHKAFAVATSTGCNGTGFANSNLNQVEVYPNEQNAVMASNTVIHHKQHMRRLMQHLHQHHEALEELDDETAQAFGRYYGTYVAAAAARRIGSMQLTQIQRPLPAVKQSQQQKQQEATQQDAKLRH